MTKEPLKLTDPAEKVSNRWETSQNDPVVFDYKSQR